LIDINTPKEINDEVIDFCKSITPNATPEYVKLCPEPQCIENECYYNVDEKVKTCGGKKQLGWRIQVVPDPLPKFMIEAVHHAIWISGSGEKIDITPHSHSANNIVFVSDDLTKFKTYRIGEKYCALLNCPIVKEYVQLCNLESIKYTSKTKLTKQPKIPQKLKVTQMELLHQIAMKYADPYD